MSQKSYFKFFNPTFALREPALKLYKRDFLLGYLIILILKVGKVMASGYYNSNLQVHVSFLKHILYKFEAE